MSAIHDEMQSAGAVHVERLCLALGVGDHAGFATTALAHRRTRVEASALVRRRYGVAASAVAGDSALAPLAKRVGLLFHAKSLRAVVDGQVVARLAEDHDREDMRFALEHAARAPDLAPLELSCETGREALQAAVERDGWGSVGAWLDGLDAQARRRVVLAEAPGLWRKVVASPRHRSVGPALVALCRDG